MPASIAKKCATVAEATTRLTNVGASFSPSNAASSTPLEVGTLGGYTAIWLATENPGFHVTTIGFDPYYADAARENIKAVGGSEPVEVILGAGRMFCHGYMEDIQVGKRERVGFTFGDVDGVNNWKYVDWAIEMSLPRACIVVDNVFAKGELTDANSTDSMVLGGGEGGTR